MNSNTIIQIKNFKPSNNMMDDSLAFSGSLWIDGKRVAYLRDNGNGGGVDYDPVEHKDNATRAAQATAINSLNKACKAAGGGVTLDWFLMHIAEHMNRARQLKNSLRGKIWYRRKDTKYAEGEWHTSKVKMKDTPENRQVIVRNAGEITEWRNDIDIPWNLTKFGDIVTHMVTEKLPATA